MLVGLLCLRDATPWYSTRIVSCERPPKLHRHIIVLISYYYGRFGNIIMIISCFVSTNNLGSLVIIFNRSTSIFFVLLVQSNLQVVFSIIIQVSINTSTIQCRFKNCNTSIVSSSLLFNDIHDRFCMVRQRCWMHRTSLITSRGKERRARRDDTRMAIDLVDYK